MRFMEWAKDGGPDSTVDGLYFIEIKHLFSIVLLKFNDGSRENYHNHAFNAWSWLLSGMLLEEVLNGNQTISSWIRPSLKPIFTPRERLHKVHSDGVSWAITFRGPWYSTWKEYSPGTQKFIDLTNGRKVLA